MTRVETGWVVFAGVLGLLNVAVVVAFAVWVSGFNYPEMMTPTTPYQVQVKRTLRTFDLGQRANFDALYPHSLPAQRDYVWNACSTISPQGRSVKSKLGAGQHIAAATLSGVDKADSTKRLTCVFTLDADQTEWDIYLWVPDTAAPSVGPPEKP